MKNDAWFGTHGGGAIVISSSFYVLRIIIGSVFFVGGRPRRGVYV